MDYNFAPTQPQTRLTNPAESLISGLIKAFTLRRVFVYAFLLSMFCLAVRQCTIIDPDFWWHLRSGQYILEVRSIPHVDPFSFTKGGSEWVAHEWLSEVIIAGVFRFAGWPGLLVTFGLIITATLGICYWRSEAQPFIAGATTLLGALASAPLFGLRPQMITLLFASVFIAVLEVFQKRLRSKMLWLLPCLMILWVNLHAGFAVGIALIALFTLMSILDREWRSVKPLLVTLAACVVAIPFNPNGLRLLKYPFETLSSSAMQSLIQEWFSPDFHKPGFLPLAILMLSTFAFLALAPQRPKRGELVGLLALTFAALRSGRHVPLYAIFAAPMLSKYFSAWAKSKNFTIRSGPQISPTKSQIILNIALLALPIFVAVRKTYDFNVNESVYEHQRVPAAAVSFLQDKKLSGPIFNDYNWGGYLIWRLYPDQKVFVDGRADVYGDEFLFDYLRTYRGEPGWRERLNSFGIKTVLIEPQSSLSSLLREEPGWRVVFEDGQAVVFNRD